MGNDIKKVDLESEDLVDDRLRQLKKLVPEAFSESGIDFDKLRLLLGDEVDEGNERYAFTWPGKADAIRQSQTSTTATLRPVVEKSRSRDGKDGSFDSDNIYIEGDNLEALKLLQRAYHGKVKMIYIDPPYNTGHDFVYKDKFGDTIENYKKQTGQAGQSNPETNGRFHSDWCSMMYPRLKLARELLSEDGVLTFSIGENEIDNAVKICDELFGQQNRIALFSRAMKSGGAKGTFYTPSVDYILFYARDIDATAPFRAPFTEEQIKTFYKNTETSGPHAGELYGEERLFKASLDPRPNQRYYIQCPDGSFAIPPGPTLPKHLIEGETVLPTARDKVWKWIYPRYESELEAGRIVFKQTSTSGLVDQFGHQSKWNIYNKLYLSEQQEKGGVVPSNLLTQFENRQSSRELKALSIPFDYAKPVGLIRFLIQIIGVATDEVVLDFFSGSSSTAHAVMLQNIEDGQERRFIMVQLPEKCEPSSEAGKQGYSTLCDIGEERIRRAGNKIAEEVAEANNQPKLGEEPKKLPDIGFRVFRLDESGIAEPKDGQLLIDRRKDGRSDLDIIFEVMLKWGYELTYPIEKTELAGYGCYSVAAGDLICCMEPGLTVDALEAIAAEQPRRVFIMDSVFGYDDSLKLDALAIFKHAEEQTQQKIELRTV
ncbi:site-specific DNA-methyltransferase [Bifidobacterium thermacidophilum]|uniref:Site-specific DNA-methyltransferase n=1 Tax=Bifidobacterium thermacidophilum subsp. thermacidophilum TaxID=79262 RepID=A0A087E2G4_9BIFI|nr:site-specific DNA-methyltransferase [Bifidobacterium thermacidophilum]KFJ01965.1 site-specific DNA-methyltransferase [Bifidobacterium thermacidophilum subsp. thermacidophilum]